jgi:hypothetical protein
LQIQHDDDGGSDGNLSFPKLLASLMDPVAKLLLEKAQEQEVIEAMAATSIDTSTVVQQAQQQQRHAQV